MFRKSFALIMSIVLLLSFASCRTVKDDPKNTKKPDVTQPEGTAKPEGKTTLYQIVPETQSLMNSYVIKTKNNKIIVIDGGIDGAGKDAPTYLYKELQTISGQDKPEIEAWFFSHIHWDHYYEFVKMYEAKKGEFTVKNIYLNFPSDEFISKNEPSELTYFPRFKKAYNEIFGENAYENYNGVQVGDKINIDDVSFEILQIPDEKITSNAINNSSIIFRMTAEEQTVLFLGDAGVEAGNSLLRTYGDAIKSDMVQMAHHGQAGVNKSLYAKVNPQVCFWPIPSWVWANTNNQFQTNYTKKWMFEELKVKHHYIAGLYGTESIEFPFDFNQEPKNNVDYN